MKKIFDWLRDKWLAGFITATIFFILKLYFDLPIESKANFFNFMWITDLLNKQISLLYVAGIVISIFIITRIKRALLKSKNKSPNQSYFKVPKNEFDSYKRDLFGVNKTTWTWNYEWSAYKQKFIIVDLKPSCRKCGTPMEIISFHSPSSAECHKCRLEGGEYYFMLTEQIQDIEKEIVRKIHNNEVNLR
jgi:hypothetical protein